MALAQPTATDVVEFLGCTAPYQYEAGSFDGRPFPAGMTMKVCVGTVGSDGQAADFYIMKLKTEATQRFGHAIQSIPRGSMVEVTYTRRGAAFELVAIRPAPEG